MAPKKPKGPMKDKAKAKSEAAKMMADAAVDARKEKVKRPPPPPACFTPDDLARFKEIWKANDEMGLDKMPLPMIPLLLRKLGFNPKGEEIKQMFELILEDEYVDVVEYHEFLMMIEAKLTWGDDLEIAVIKAMAALGHDEAETGTCDFETLRQELQEWGEPLQDLELVDWIKLATKDKTLNLEDGSFGYLKFVDNMNSKDEKYIKEPINFFKLDQKTLAEMAIKKAAEEREEQERKEAERKAREEARRQKLIEAGLIQE